MIRKHNRRAAKAAFAIALGVAIVLGGAAAAPAALEKQQATPIIIGTKNFPEQYVLGQLYKQALEAQGLQGAVQGEHRLDRADRRVASERPRHALSRVHRDHALGHVQAEDAAEDARAAPTPRASSCTRSGARRSCGRRRSRTATRSRCYGRRRRRYGLKTVGDLRKVPDLTLAAFPEFETRVGCRSLASRYGVRNVEFTPLAGISAYTLLEPGEGRGGRHLHDRSAADLDEVRRAPGAAEHVRLPAGRARALEEARQPSTARG